MKRLLVSLAVVGSLAAIPVSNVLWGKGHVPAGLTQLCHQGTVIQVSARGLALGSHLGHQDCELPACDFNNVFHAGEDCSATTRDRGRRCSLPNPRNSSNGVTPACPLGTF